MSALRGILLLFAASALTVLAASCGGTEEPIRIAVMAPCEGPAGGAYEITLAGAELPLVQRGGRLAGASPSDGVEGVGVGGERSSSSSGAPPS